MGTPWAEGDPATLPCAAAGRRAPAETEKLESIPSVGPPSNKMGRIHNGASFYNNRRLLSLLWIVNLFSRVYSVKHLRLIKRRNVYVCMEQISSKSKLISAHVA